MKKHFYFGMNLALFMGFSIFKLKGKIWKTLLLLWI